jgi:hypothetical protein
MIEQLLSRQDLTRSNALSDFLRSGQPNVEGYRFTVFGVVS